jgi:hypothetical protein
MRLASESCPIFVHASPRSGSTYFFNVLRRNESLMCYNEAIIDVFSRYGKRDLARFKSAQKWNVNHDFLERDDFKEIVEAWDAVMHLYPPFPSFRDYLPAKGEISPPLYSYLGGLIHYARSHGKQPVFCEIHSRGRAGALRRAFGGFHIAQYRDPVSQFGSFFRPLVEAGEWGFLTFPLMELGISGKHPLYQLVPEHWRVPVLPWPADDAAQRWSSAVQYISMVASPQSSALEKAFRWHLFSWFLSNLAAVSYSDFALDIDRAYDDTVYRQNVVDCVSSNCEVRVDFSDLTKFSRYYDFDSFDVGTICAEVSRTMREAMQDGRIEGAIGALATDPANSTAAVVELLISKIEDSLSFMAAHCDRRRVSEQDWKTIATKHRRIWFNPAMRVLAQRAYPLAAPLARAARRAAIRFRVSLVV